MKKQVRDRLTLSITKETNQIMLKSFMKQKTTMLNLPSSANHINILTLKGAAVDQIQVKLRLNTTKVQESTKKI